MKICFFSPYFYHKHAGGGERHILSIASYVASLGHHVDIAVSSLDQGSLSKKELKNYNNFYQNFTGLDLSKLNFIETPLFTSASFFSKLWWTKQYDYLYYASDGSLFFSLAGLNNLHIQIPFTRDLSFLDKLKLKNWHIINTNSEFTKSVIQKKWQHNNILVHHPCVDVREFKTSKKTKKENIILGVGRFFQHQHHKRQDILIDIFAKLKKIDPKIAKDYKLVLVGSVESQEYLEELKEKAKKLNVEFLLDIDRKKLISLFHKSKFFWHATGYKIDEHKYPDKVEHFGIVTLEAMASKTVPLVCLKGGQKEILQELSPDLGWNSSLECALKTIDLIKKPELYEKMQESIYKKVDNFKREVFEKKVKQQF